MTSPVLQFKRGLSSNIGIASFKAGEPGFTTDKYDFYIGLDATAANQKFFGSARYWKRENATDAAQVKLVDKDGTNFIGIAASNTLSGIATYRLPDTTNGSTGDFLKLRSSSGGYYDLEWAAVPSGSFSIAGDTGTDTFTTGETLTFVGGTNLTSAVTNNTVTVNLDSNVDITNLNVTGITTLAGNITLGDNTSDNITVGGEFVSNLTPSTTNTYDLGTSSQRWRNGWFGGNINVAGIITAVGYSDLTIANKDIVMAYIDGVTETDVTANHGGIAVASTEGSPLINMDVAGINTLPSTYKQLMWVKSNTFTGLTTDAWMFNYGVAIGTTTMANGIRLAVGTGVTVTDTEVSATTFRGALVGNVTGSVSSADQVKTISASDTNATYYVTFVDANNGSSTNETVYTDDGIYYNPGTNTFTTQHGYFTGNVTVVGTTTTGTLKLSGTSGIGITGISTSTTLSENSDAYLPTQKAVKAYVDAVDLTLGITADSGGPSTVNTSQTLTIAGTSGETETSVSGQTITVGLPDTVIVGTALSTPTLKTATIQHLNGTQAATIDTSGNITASQNFTVSGNLYVNGSTTQVNTSTTTIEDQLLELGMVDGSAPTSDLDKDVGVLLNYYSASAKKAAMFWDDSASRIVFADDVTESSGVLTVTSNAYAAIEVEALWVNDCAGQSQVIACSGTTRTLENITIDGGSF